MGSAEVPEGAAADEGGTQQVRAGLLRRGRALSWVAGAPPWSEHVPRAGSCPGGLANDPAHSGLHGPENWLRAGPLAGILPTAHTSEWKRGGRSEKLKKS